MRRAPLRWTFFIALTLAVGYLSLKRLASTSPAVSTPTRNGDVPGADLDHQAVTVRSTDGLALNAWWVPGKRNLTRTVVLVHAWGDSKSSPYVSEAARIYHQAGFNVLALDLRGQGRLQGTAFHRRLPGGA